MKKPVLILLILLTAAVLTADVIRQDHVSLREGSGAFYPVLAVLPAGSDVTIIQNGDTWAEVRTAANLQGFIPALAFDDSRHSIDYGVLAGEIADREISKTIVSAAVKGFFENRLSSTDVNRDVMSRPLRRSFSAEEYRRFTADTYRNSPWDHEKYMKKLRIDSPGSLKIDNSMMATSAYIAGRLTAPGLLKDAAKTRYVNMVAQLVAESTEFYDLPLTVYIADTDEIFANSTPIGVIIISKGMLNMMDSENQLACLLGHEISHITLGHGMTEAQKRKPKVRAEAAFDALDTELDEEPNEVEADLEQIADDMYERSIKGRKESYEAAADTRGALYAARAGYDPRGMITLMSRLEGKMKRGMGDDEPTHWFPYSFVKRKAGLETYYHDELERRASRFVTHQDRWNSVMK